MRLTTAMLVTCALIVHCLRAPESVHRFIAVRPLARLGAMSYSFYLLHAPLLLVTYAIAGPIVGAWLGAGVVRAGWRLFDGAKPG